MTGPSRIPFEILGIAPHADDEEIRAAYLRKVKEFPPEKAPAEFEKIRDAWEALRDPRRRAAAMFLTDDFGRNLASLVENRKPRRLCVGPQMWREVLKSQGQISKE